MRLILTMILAGTLLGCTHDRSRADAPAPLAGPVDPLDQDRLCRMYEMEGRPDPQCPAALTEPPPRRAPTEETMPMPALPTVPDVRRRADEALQPQAR